MSKEQTRKILKQDNDRTTKETYKTTETTYEELIVQPNRPKIDQHEPTEYRDSTQVFLGMGSISSSSKTLAIMIEYYLTRVWYRKYLNADNILIECPCLKLEICL